jgi:dTDP-4-dehydrorhamnose 3,5-epimerase
MTVHPTPLAGLLEITPRRFGDERGYFFECYNRDRYRDHGIPAVFVQDNVSFSRRNVLRGLHLQDPHPQAKLVWVVTGEVYDVAVDVRPHSETFGQWHGLVLSEENGRQLFIPEGFAHGFTVLSEAAVFMYKCSDFYHPEAERTLQWDDPAVAVEWPVAVPLLSPKDADGEPLKAFR